MQAQAMISPLKFGLFATLPADIAETVTQRLETMRQRRQGWSFGEVLWWKKLQTELTQERRMF
jgi:hypothetical protein